VLISRGQGYWRGQSDVDGWRLLCSIATVNCVVVLDCSTEGIFKKFGENVFKMNCYITREMLNESGEEEIWDAREGSIHVPVAYYLRTDA